VCRVHIRGIMGLGHMGAYRAYNEYRAILGRLYVQALWAVREVS